MEDLKQDKEIGIEKIVDASKDLRERFNHINGDKVLRRIDLRVMPILSLLYLFSFLDRSNIGNAKIQGLVEDLDLHGNRYNLCCEFDSAGTR